MLSFKNKYFFFSLAACLLLFASCRQVDVFEKNTTIPGYKWDYQFKAEGSFTIADTTSPYNIYIVLRHTDAYKYNNIWLNVGLKAPGDSMRFQKVNLELATETGGWDGTGMNDIWEVRKLFIRVDPQREKISFKKGLYNFSISQVMRDNPLPHIMSVGLRVDKEAL